MLVAPLARPRAIGIEDNIAAAGVTNHKGGLKYLACANGGCIEAVRGKELLGNARRITMVDKDIAFVGSFASHHITD